MEHEVIIVGGGPVGIGLAIELGQRGHSVAVVERHREPQPIPKGQNLTQRTMEHMRAWGCEAELRAARIIPPGYAIGGMTCYGQLLTDYHYDWLQREKVRPYYFTDNERLPQYLTEAVLRARAAELPNIALHYGWQATGLRQVADRAEALIEERAGPGRATLRGRFLVGADGSRGIVREAAGIPETRRDHDRLMALLVFRSEELHEILKCFPGKQFYNVLHPDLKGYWQFFGRVDLGSTWFFHAPVPLGTTTHNHDFAAMLHRAVGRPFALELQHVGFWELRVALADRYRRDCVFLAGDAAHSHPPYGGYGINTGFEDARNLGWKLSATLQGWAGPALLDSYDAERRPVFASTARDFIERFIEDDRAFLAAHDPAHDRAGFERAWSARGDAAEVTAFEPHYEGSLVVAGGGGPPSARGAHVFAARPGHHLAPAGEDDTGDRLGPGFTLLSADPATARALAEAATAAHLPLRQGGLAAKAVARYAARSILVRPDGYVAWAEASASADAGTETGAAAILARAVGAAPA